ncbi:hypothetical protein PR048_014032 [Dryococelus australis]|uniref:Uncharacterized protein n=1 Tax=Dryococelus australis TaxID=614101 RepID=A0ABQ9HUS4_9NEOP|nr:hypothetical protein PR048_014032 [Dryococelus australis]
MKKKKIGWAETRPAGEREKTKGKVEPSLVKKRLGVVRREDKWKGSTDHLCGYRGESILGHHRLSGVGVVLIEVSTQEFCNRAGRHVVSATADLDTLFVAPSCVSVVWLWQDLASSLRQCYILARGFTNISVFPQCLTACGPSLDTASLPCVAGACRQAYPRPQHWRQVCFFEGWYQKMLDPKRASFSRKAFGWNTKVDAVYHASRTSASRHTQCDENTARQFKNLALSGVGALDECASVALIASKSENVTRNVRSEQRATSLHHAIRMAVTSHRLVRDVTSEWHLDDVAAFKVSATRCANETDQREQNRCTQFCKLKQNKRAGETGDPAQTRRPVASSDTIPTCENPGLTRPGIELCSPWWEASSLTAQPPWPPGWALRTCGRSATILDDVGGNLRLYHSAGGNFVCWTPSW